MHARITSEKERETATFFVCSTGSFCETSHEDNSLHQKKPAELERSLTSTIQSRKFITFGACRRFPSKTHRNWTALTGNILKYTITMYVLYLGKQNVT